MTRSTSTPGPGRSRRLRRGRPVAAALLGMGLLLGGCAGANPADEEAVAAVRSTPSLPPLPTREAPAGAPLVDLESPGSTSGDVGHATAEPTPEPSDDADDKKDKDEDEEEKGMDAPTPFPGWMTKPAADRDVCPAPTVRVRTADQLQKALDRAGPGTSIWMEPGVYRGTFVTTASGTATSPAALCGEAGAVLHGNGYKGDYVLHLDGAQHWVLHGFTVRNGQKGVMADGTTGTTISGLTVYGIGDEAIHLRRYSTDNLVAHNTISDTGLRKPKFGEGVYVGTANSNWGDLTDGEPDTSDRNRVVGNAIYATSSESVDVKEGTTGGEVSGNQFDGSIITGADSWVDVKGNDWTITGNVGRSTPLDGFQTHDVADGWGTRNVFSGNSGSLDDREGLLVALRPVNENRVRCDNRLLGSVGGLSNVDCR